MMVTHSKGKTWVACKCNLGFRRQVEDETAAETLFNQHLVSDDVIAELATRINQRRWAMG